MSIGMGRCLGLIISAGVGLLSIGLFPQSSWGLSAPEIAKIAKDSAVEIVSDDSRGSGIIIKQEGSQYFVLTAAHVVKERQNYKITTADEQQYSLAPTDVRSLPGVDLAIVKFTSTKRYPIPKLGNAYEATEGKVIYVSGFPLTAAIDRAIFNFTDGKVTANSSRPLKDGYSLIYSNNTLPGMSGGGVFNDKGELIAIHGKGDVDTKITTSQLNPEVRVKTGFNLGIAINTFQQLASKIGINAGTAIAANPAQPKADNFVLAGFDRVSKNDIPGSIVEFSKALAINPQLNSAQFWRGACRLLVGDMRGAIADLDKAIAKNPKRVDAYMYRGSAHAKLGNRQLALADLDRAVALNPKSAVAFGNRCALKFQLKDFSGAVGDCDRAIAIEPKEAFYYGSRGSAYYQLARYREAIADHNTSIKLDPKNIFAYINRGIARAGSNDLTGAIADYNLALNFKPTPKTTATALAERGIVKVRSGDRSGALADFDRAIALDKDLPAAYFQRGLIKATSNKAGAIADFQSAADLYLKLGDKEKSQQALAEIAKLRRK